ncbi:MAG: aspartate 1-decarboxylase [Candidatus Omnitrophota bacterium]
MFRIICKSKIENAIVTKKSLSCSGSIGIDKNLLEACNVYPNEIVQVLNMNNGARFETYAIEEREGSGAIALYGPAARLGEVGDPLVILSQAIVDGKEVPNAKIKIVSLDSKNRIIKR